MKNCISINIKRDLMILKINDDADIKEILICLKRKLIELKKLYQDEQTPMLFVGKILKNKEMDLITKMVKKFLDVSIEFETPRKLGLHGIKKCFKKEIATSETKFIRNSLRSGFKVEFEGSVVVLGDVNYGAEVIARDNIVILGVLRGLAHAGAKGNAEAIISAASIETKQLRISNIVREFEQKDLNGSVLKTNAYVDENNEIVVE